MLGDSGQSISRRTLKAGSNSVFVLGTLPITPSPHSFGLPGSEFFRCSFLFDLLLKPLSSSWDLHVTSSCHRIKIYSVNRARPETAKRLKLLEEHGEDIYNLSHPPEFSLEPLDEYLAQYRKYPREPED